MATGFTPLTVAEVSELESSLGAEFPETYRHLLARYGAAGFERYVKFPVVKGVSVMDMMKGEMPAEIALLPFGMFYGSDANGYGLIKHIKTYMGRMPESLIPVGGDGFGNQICLCISGQQRGKVYWWDHENEWDEDDYEDDYGEPMPPEAKFQNVYLVAESFDEFFRKLEVAE